ncbi:glycoside hydrolase family 19 protein [Desulfovibrio sulfodismutans]|uniref:Glycoside hydrolase family 19 protein n=1 Tax=Desulfolutivibrio sulfodismutans TaxID=63561 RepID=A0A7K3NKF4_9BACT|nr:glycoside hydrolase family 19 protein [Desulfolutivibrio sulfodismutans]NDY56660.1 glycoside hydrolase family 19 protein [Desulfolutivibrio sulfodismutans]QLA11240.1 glycoside hydrolase family 19 protein [Desulfolutivibrio sulfodismutans DSM 3696]
MDLLPVVDALAPQALPVVRQAFATSWPVFERWRMTSFLVLAHFLAHAAHETRLFRALTENLRYSAKRLTEVWEKRFPTLEAARPYAWDPSDPDPEDVALANLAYGSRMGNEENGTDDDDGWRYRGQGIFHLTGRGAYRQIGQMVGVDIEADPSLVLSEHLLIPCACAFWTWKGMTPYAESDDLRSTTRLINGGDNGLADRAIRLAQAKRLLGV